MHQFAAFIKIRNTKERKAPISFTKWETNALIVALIGCGCIVCYLSFRFTCSSL